MNSSTSALQQDTEASPLTNSSQVRRQTPQKALGSRFFRFLGFEPSHSLHNDSKLKIKRIVVLSLYLGVILLAFVCGRSLDRQETESQQESAVFEALKDRAFVGDLKNGAVASDHAVCSTLGKEILQKGGNAVDSAVTTVLCLGVANPASSGLGGGAFILVHSDRAHHEARYGSTETAPLFEDKRDPHDSQKGSKITEVIDCRETAPSASTEDMFASLPDDASSFGALAIAVPGELRGLELTHARHGSMAWSELVEPVIKLAIEGVPVSEHLASDIHDLATRDYKLHGSYPPLRDLVTKRNSWESYLREGEILKNQKLAETLQKVGEQGSSAFYEGDLAEELVDEIQSLGGSLSIEDLANYKPVLRSPVYGSTKGFTIVGVPPPSSGGATLIGAARFLGGYDLPFASFAETLSVHRMVESLRHAFAIRMSLSDPAFSNNKTARAVEDLTSNEYMESLRKITLDNSTLSLSRYGGERWAQLHNANGTADIVDQHEGDRKLRDRRRLARTFGYLEDSGTSHLSIVDKDGNSVAITSSINQIFGSYVLSESTGVLMGNTMDDFGNPGRSNYYGLKPSKENFIAPGKRPLSSMSPTMVFRSIDSEFDGDFGRLVLVLGGSGGPKIITAVLQVFLNYCFLGLSIFDAVARPRVHDQLMYHDAAVTTTEKDVLEDGYTIEVSERTKEALLSRGHERLLDIDYAGTVQVVAVDLETNTLSAVSDIRKGGSPAGY